MKRPEAVVKQLHQAGSLDAAVERVNALKRRADNLVQATKRPYTKPHEPAQRQ